MPFRKINRVNVLPVLLPTVPALLATSPPPSHYYTRTAGNLTCYRCNVTVNYTREEIVKKFRKRAIVFDSIAPVEDDALEKVPL